MILTLEGYKTACETLAAGLGLPAPTCEKRRGWYYAEAGNATSGKGAASDLGAWKTLADVLAARARLRVRAKSAGYLDGRNDLTRAEVYETSAREHVERLRTQLADAEARLSDRAAEANAARVTLAGLDAMLDAPARAAAEALAAVEGAR